MGVIVDPADFTGYFKVPNNNFVSIDDIITQKEKYYLRRLLGITLYNLFVADLVGQVPQTAPYTTIFNEINEDDNTCIRTSRGIKNMLLGLLKWEYLRTLSVQFTMAGPVKNKVDASEKISYDDTLIDNFFNESVEDWETIQWYIEENKSDFPDYNGQVLSPTHWIL